MSTLINNVPTPCFWFKEKCCTCTPARSLFFILNPPPSYARYCTEKFPCLIWKQAHTLCDWPCVLPRSLTGSRCSRRHHYLRHHATRQIVPLFLCQRSRSSVWLYDKRKGAAEQPGSPHPSASRLDAGKRRIRLSLWWCRKTSTTSLKARPEPG